MTAPIEFRVTFGSAHAGQWVDRVGGPLTHPNGWVTIIAPDEMAARMEANRRFERGWAFIYQKPLTDEWEQDAAYRDWPWLFPMRELGCIEAVTA